ncbi:MAG: hypothetical protein Q8R83_02500 [Legionellaceae bacterium]|nr:hypothetical protein [Legionellaceae bacterium]
MKIQSQGFILLTTLLMISTVSLLVLSLFQSLFLYFKMSNQWIDNHQAFYQLEDIAEEISQGILAGATRSCVFIDHELSQRSLNQKGCILEKNNQTYHYAMIDLGLYPCLAILKDKKKFSSHHWLLSVISDHLPEHVLQFRLATIGKPLHNVSSTTGMISVGRMSWQYRLLA